MTSLTTPDQDIMLPSQASLMDLAASFNSLFGVSPLGMALFDRKCRYISINHALAALNRLPIEAHLGRVIWDVVPHLEPLLKDVFQAVLDRGEVFPGLELSHDSAGQDHLRSFNASFHPVYDHEKHIIGLICTVAEITAQKKVEKAVLATKERLETVLDSARLGSWHWCIPAGTVEFNERWADMLGYQLDEIEPCLKTWEQLVHPDDKLRVLDVLQKHLDGQTPLYECEYRLKHKQGHWIWVLSRGRVVEYDMGGRPAIVTGTHLDITDRKNDEERLRASEERFRQLAEANPVGVVIGGEDGALNYANPAIINMLGYSTKEFEQGKVRWAEITPPEFAARDE